MDIMRISGSEYLVRPYSPVSKYSTEIIDFAAYGYFEGKNRYQNLQKLSTVEKEALLGQSFLDQRIL